MSVPSTAASRFGAAQTPRVTQGFVGTVTWTRRHPALVFIEIAWRWIFGIPALLLLAREGERLLDGVPWRATGVAGLTINQLLTDPVRTAASLAAFAELVMPPLLHTARWLAPVLLLWWVLVSGAGRTFVLGRLHPGRRRRFAPVMLLQMLRLVPLCVLGAVWWFTLQWLARLTVLRDGGGEPEVMIYAGGAIALTLGLFVLSAATSWVFGMAPVVSVADTCSAGEGMRRTLQARQARGPLFEMNLVLGIVKIALLVLAMVLSACPLPFSSVMSGEALVNWNIAVGVAYLLASDFFHVARLVAYSRLWQARSALPA